MNDQPHLKRDATLYLVKYCCQLLAANSFYIFYTYYFSQLSQRLAGHDKTHGTKNFERLTRTDKISIFSGIGLLNFGPFQTDQLRCSHVNSAIMSKKTQSHSEAFSVFCINVQPVAYTLPLETEIHSKWILL